MKQRAKIHHLVNWFFGNYCTRKCYEENEKSYQHWLKLQEIAKRLEGVEMTHKEFLVMIRSDRTICDLSDEEWRKRKFSWRRSDCALCRMMGVRI